MTPVVKLIKADKSFSSKFNLQVLELVPPSQTKNGQQNRC